MLPFFFFFLHSQRKAGSIPQGRRLVTVVVLNGQNLQVMIEVLA